MIEYKVKLYFDGNFVDNVYEVIRFESTFVNEEEDDTNLRIQKSVFKGKLSDCESYIRLKVGGYLI